jgi:hypothetical protein
MNNARAPHLMTQDTAGSCSMLSTLCPAHAALTAKCSSVRTTQKDFSTIALHTSLSSIPPATRDALSCAAYPEELDTEHSEWWLHDAAPLARAS